MAVPDTIMDLNSLVMLNTLFEFLQHPDIIDDSLKKKLDAYLDLFTSPFSAHFNVCHQNLFRMLSLCDRIGAPIKTE